MCTCVRYEAVYATMCVRKKSGGIYVDKSYVSPNSSNIQIVAYSHYNFFSFNFPKRIFQFFH